MYRIRTNTGTFPGDILDGLPFHSRKDTMMPSVASAEEIVSKRGINEDENLSESAKCPTTADNVLNWRDPQTGQVIQLDMRTGQAFRQSPTSAQAGTDGGPNGHMLALKKSAAPRKRLQANRADVVRNLDHYGFGMHRCSKDSNTPTVKDCSVTQITNDDVCHGSSCHARTENYEAERHISRRMLMQSQAISQVDGKFILARFGTYHWSQCSFLGLVDQHAADERCRVEQLFSSLLTEPYTRLPEPLVYDLLFAEVRELARTQALFKRWQVNFEVSFSRQQRCAKDIGMSNSNQLLVTTLPACVSVRCRANPELVIEMIREQAACKSVRLSPSTVPLVSKGIPAADIPAGLLELINSRACRSSIMFNDELDVSQCQDLLTRLSSCTLPFQCAHGRRFMYVLPDMPNLSTVHNFVEIGYY